MKTILTQITQILATLTTVRANNELMPQLIPVRVITNNFHKKANP